VAGDPGLAEEVARVAPEARVLDADGLGYDEAKMLAAREARGRFVAYLDGDCIAEPGWLDAVLGPLRSGEALASGGFTRYEGGFVAGVQTLLDFGFLHPLASRPLECYAANNCAFDRATLLAEPMPGGPLRCRCFHHAQRLKRRGSAMLLAPPARVRHEPQPLLRERSRQGYDVVAACWADPALPEAALLRLGRAATPLFYALVVALDIRRLFPGGRAVGIRAWQWPAALLLFPLLRLVDAAGMWRALREGPRPGGWGGYFDVRAARTAGVASGARLISSSASRTAADEKSRAVSGAAR
jgi:Glycosyl transferase family 2